MEYLPKLIRQIAKQKKVPALELIIADTYSTDGSWEYIKRIKELTNLRIKVLRIKPRNFGHGKTRNELVKIAKGKIIVFISQDIKITSNLWLYHLIKPLEKSEVGAAFSRQIPHPDANLYDKFFYSQAYPNKNRIIDAKNLTFGVDTIFFSMVSAAAKKSLLIKYPFVKDKDASIDQWWAKTVIEKGFKIAYVSKTVVYHSHNYSLKELFKRNFYSGQSLIGFPKEPFLKSLVSILKYLQNEAGFVWMKRGVAGLLKMMIYETVRILGFVLGSQYSKFLP